MGAQSRVSSDLTLKHRSSDQQPAEKVLATQSVGTFSSIGPPDRLYSLSNSVPFTPPRHNTGALPSDVQRQLRIRRSASIATRRHHSSDDDLTTSTITVTLSVDWRLTVQCRARSATHQFYPPAQLLRDASRFSKNDHTLRAASPIIPRWACAQDRSHHRLQRGRPHSSRQV